MKTKSDEKGDKDDMLKQSNKGHRGIREKLKKKRKQEKEIKKQKKEKKKEKKLRELRKQAKKEKRDQKREDNESDDDDLDSGDKLYKYIKRLKVFMEEEVDDLFEMFETLDAGGEVNIEDLENGKVKNYLKKIFKYFNLNKNKETNEFSKDTAITPECLKKKFQDIWYQGVDTESSDSDDDDKKKDKKMESEEEEEEQEKRKEMNEEEVKKAKDALLEGLKGIPQEAPKEKQPEADNEPDGVKRIPGEEWRSFLDEKFGSLVGDDRKGYSKLSKKMDGTGEERTEKDKKIDEFMTDYNSQFRKKTLLEEHQERKKNAMAGKQQERRAFDRDLDINMSRIDSKKVFQMINNKDSNLGSRFGHSNSGNKYL